MPFGNDNDKDLFTKIRTADYDMETEKWKQTSLELRQVINGLLELDPSRRFTVDDVLEHEWIQKQLPLLQKLYQKLF